MDGQSVTKLPGKLITRSKSKTSIGDRQMVNFLENLSKDETGAPIKWKFNKSGVRFAKGIGKKLADVSKSSKSSLYVDSTVKIARSLLKKHVKKHIDQSLKKLPSAEPQAAQFTDGIIKRKRGRPKKIQKPVTSEHDIGDKEAGQCTQVSEEYDLGNRLTSQPAAAETVVRKRGRPKKIVTESTNKLGTQTDAEFRNWTQLNKKVFQQSLQGIAVKKALKMRCSSEERGDSDRIDSEMETESVDSNISNSSESRKPKKFNRYGIKLGPRKLLRSQDSLVTRHSKVVSNATMKAIRKPRKRTLSGEFELLDESSLRKKIKQSEEADSLSLSAELKMENEKLQENTNFISTPSVVKKRGRPPKISTDNLNTSKTDLDISSVESDSKNVQNLEPETFSVKSMKHPSLLRKQEVRNINLKKQQVETSTYMNAVLPFKESSEKVVKRGPGRPKSKLSSTSNDLPSENSQIRPSEDKITEKKTLEQCSKPPYVPGLSPHRGLQIVGPGGMKFTKKAKVSENVELKKETKNTFPSLKLSQVQYQTEELKSHSGQGLLKAEEFKSQSSQDLPKSEELKPQSGYALLKTEELKSQSGQALLNTEELKSRSGQDLMKSEELKSLSAQGLLKAEELKSHSGQGLLKAEELKSHSGQGLPKAEELKSHSGQGLLKAEELPSQSGQGLLKTQELKSKSDQAILKSEELKSESGQAVLKTEELPSQSGQAVLKVDGLTSQTGQALEKADKLTSRCDQDHQQTEELTSHCNQGQQQTERLISQNSQAQQKSEELIPQYDQDQQQAEELISHYDQAQQQTSQTNQTHHAEKFILQNDQAKHAEELDRTADVENSTNELGIKQTRLKDKQKSEEDTTIQMVCNSEESERPESETLVVSVISEDDNSHTEKEPEVTENLLNQFTEKYNNDLNTEPVSGHVVCTYEKSKKEAETISITNINEQKGEIHTDICKDLASGKNEKSFELEGDYSTENDNDSLIQSPVKAIEKCQSEKDDQNPEKPNQDEELPTELNSPHNATNAVIPVEGNNISIETMEDVNSIPKDTVIEQMDISCETDKESSYCNSNEALSEGQNNELKTPDNYKEDDNTIFNVTALGTESATEDTASEKEAVDQTKQYISSESLVPDNSGDKTIEEESDIHQINLSKNTSAFERVTTPTFDGDKRSSSPEIDNHSNDGGMDSSPELKTYEKQIPEKRQIQLRQKASRSPLEIIAMRQSQEERQYILEQTQKAIRREEKQKKMKEKHRKILEDEKEREKDIGKIASKQHDKEEIDSDNTTEEEQEMKEPAVECKPCTVVLIDFVKYLKNSSYSIQSGSVLEEWETVEDTDVAISSVDSSEPTTSDQEIVTAQTSVAEENNEVAKLSNNQNDDHKVDESKPAKKKRRASARKQVRSITYSAQLTAEIVSNPMLLFNDESQTTVPPLRLKIKQNIVAKPKFHRQKKGLKFTSKKQHKARKGMSPAKKNPSPAYIDSAISADEPDAKKQKLDEMNGEGFVGSFVQFIQNRDDSRVTKDPKSSTVVHKRSTRGQQKKMQETSFETMIPRYKCTFKSCQFVANTKSVIESHIYVHLKNTPFRCLHCNNIFKNRGETCIHIRNMHPNCDMKMGPAESVDERMYYEELTMGDEVIDPAANSSFVTASKNSPEAAIIKVVLPKNVNDSVGCYYCSYCDYSASNQQNVLEHIHGNHDNELLYACSVCSTSVQGSKEDITRHFAEVHPNQQVVYKCLPEFSDTAKNSQDGLNQDKGNIFDRMNDLFTQPEHGKKPAFPQKTSAEADSTTVESEEHPQTNKNIAVQDTSQPEEASNSDRLTTETPQSDASEDMCLKIVDVVSLRDQMPEEWLGDQESSEDKSVTPKETADPQKSVSIIDTVRTGGRLQQRPRGVFPPLGPLPSRNLEVKSMNTYGTTYKCERCNVHAPVLSAMVEHLRVTHKDIARLFLCPFCRQYEGVSELEIHRHIKQFHHSPCQKSPPVALSSAAKKHLRTIQVPAGDARKIGDKYVIEKDIYKCLKCQKHMPTLDFIYDHLEKTHNEVFVYVCPYCKLFKSKREEIVYHHIRKDHDRNATDIMLSLAIEENLFTRIQSLVKDKQKQGQKTQSSPHPQPQQRQTQKRSGEEDVIVVGESRPQAVINQINNISQAKNQPVLNLQLVSPMSVNQQPVRMPLQPPDKQSVQIHRAASSPIPSLSKSSLRKSRPHHIPQTNQNPQKPIITSQEYERSIQTMDQKASKDNALQSQSSVAPPPLIRGPPPLLRFPLDVQTFPQNSIQPIQSQQNRHPVPRNSSAYAMGKQLINYQSIQSPPLQQQSMDSATRGYARHARPVLKVPSITQQYSRQQAMVNPNVSTSIQNMSHRQAKQTFTNSARPDGAAPLDLSRPPPEKQTETKTTQPAVDDELPPDAFQIFNLRPALQRMPTNRPMAPGQNMNRFSYPSRMHPPVQTMGRMPIPRYHAPQMIARHPPPYNAVAPSMVNKNAVPPQHMLGKPTSVQTHLRLPSQSVSPTVGDGVNKDQNLAKDDERVFKCPYCPNIVPLGMGEVAPHTEKFHPGHSIVFVKIDKAS